MDEATEMLVDGLIEQEDLVGASIKWAGGDYPCVGGAEIDGRTLEAFGFQTDSEVTVVVRTALFAAGTGLPQSKQAVSYTSSRDDTAKALRIEKATPFRGALLVLQCQSPNQGS